MAGKKTGGLGGEPLCCCEYESEAGERSHILACCCDCQALDDVCDRFFKCQSVPKSTVDRLIATVADRCRLPAVTGRGAVKMPLDIMVPVVTVPTCLLFASLGPTATVMAFVFMPSFLLLFYQLWRRQGKRRTGFYYAWGLASVGVCYLVFQTLVVSFREILLWEILLQVSSTAAMIYALYKTKGNPGWLRSGEHSGGKRGRGRGESSPANGMAVFEQGGEAEGAPLYKPGTDAVIQIDQSAELDASVVKWVDSRPIRDGKLISWCSSCSFKRPPRAGHCTVCDACIAVRDHHCVWIDHCIGANNHRWFMGTMALFVWCGCYGSHLALTSVCTPMMVYDWFLFPNDCRFLYQNFYTSMTFVCVVYTLIAVVMVLVNLLYQGVLISQNVTSQELHASLSRGHVTCRLFPSNNINSQGFLRNWLEFLVLPVRPASSKIPS